MGNVAHYPVSGEHSFVTVHKQYGEVFPELTTILTDLKAFFVSSRVPAFLVGGYIRDSLRGAQPGDLDIAILGDHASLAQDLARCFSGTYVPLGRTHQTARVVVSPRDLPYTPFEKGGIGGRWTVDVSRIEDSIQADLARRDFTVDAMALPISELQTQGWEQRIIDPFGGRSDLEKGIIRAVRPSVFQDDPARLLRAVRLAATLGFSIDSGTWELISHQARLISSTPGERVRDELLGIIALDGAKEHLKTLDDLGLLCCIIPELSMTKGVEQPREHYWEVFGHSIHTVEGAERVTAGPQRDPICDVVPWGDEMDGRFGEEVSDGHTRRTILKLGALLHDIAKPQTKAVDAAGRIRFLGHHTLGAHMSSEILSRIRLSSYGTAMVCGMVDNHLRPTQMSQGADLPTPRAVYRYFRDVGDVAIDTLYLNLADHLAARGPDLDPDGWRRHVELITHVLDVGTREQSPDRAPRLLTGHDLIREFGREYGLKPGPLIGALLEELREAQVSGEVDSPETAQEWVRRRLEDARLDGSSMAGRET